jgi:hypothetical protein
MHKGFRMKIKLICGAIVATAGLASGAQATGQEIQVDGSSNGVVVRKYSGDSAKPFFNAFVEKIREAARSSDPNINKGTAQYLKQLESGQVTGYIHQTTRPITSQELKTGIQPEDTSLPPTFAGQTTMDQTCSKNGNNTFTVIDVSYVGVPAAAGGFEWSLTRSITSVMSICPSSPI